MMNFSTNTHRGIPTHKENIPPSTKADACQHRAKQRTVLGVLSENEQRGRSLSQGSQFSKHSSVSDSSQLNGPGWPSSSSYEVYVEEACEVVLGASGQEVVSDSCDDLEADANPLQNEHMRLLMEFSLSSCQDMSVQSEPDEPLISRETFCFDYAADIYRNLRESEKRFRAKPGYLERHPEITEGMRVILVDWLVEVVQEYKLGSETLHLAVNYLDRFLSCSAFIKRNKLQLVGTAVLLVAAKYEEIFPPELNEFVYITDCTYNRKQLLRMESILLKALDFKMAAPTTHQFLRLFMSIHSVCSTTENLALYIAELSLLEMDPFHQYTPSILAAGAYFLATYTIHKSHWPDSLVSFTGYTMEKILPCLTYLHKLYIRAETHPQQAVRDKYKTSKYYCVSGIPPPTALPP
ncbi:cyclin-A1 isoform X1 [Fundulus heteroclitus]|uniref:cyclin-A1 isoform X1 n=1 Tax=Fundulus heteroclitus TaxID=8078 RepID=UPI00165A45E9|nr:cyclin-A1 isoform X1 [Fundulus heteroclitus]